jgi:selenocysteine-specific elongation factor
MSKEELKSKMPDSLGGKLFNLLLNGMIKENLVAQQEDSVRLASHTVALGADGQDIKKKILDLYRKNGLTPPYFKDVSSALNVNSTTAKDVLMLLVDEGKIIKVKEELYFDAAAVADLQQRLIDFLLKNGEIDTPQFKEMTGTSRKYVIPLIEHFDAKNVTIRIGDSRKLRKQK